MTCRWNAKLSDSFSDLFGRYVPAHIEGGFVPLYCCYSRHCLVSCGDGCFTFQGSDNFRKVKVDFSLEDMDLTELRGKATYAQVKEYILNESGLKVSSLYIAQVKKKCGLEVGKNSYLPKSEDARQPQVTPEKEEAIMKAFRHFGVIEG